MPNAGTPNRGGKRRRTSSVGAAKSKTRKGVATLAQTGKGFYNRQLAMGFTRWGQKYIIKDDGNGSINVAAATPGWSIGSASGDLAVNSNQFGISANFQLSSLPDYTEFTALFDAYKIDKVELHVNYLNNTSTAGAFVGPASATLVSGNQLPTIMMVCDKDDSGVPTNVAVLQEYGAAVVKRMDKPFVFTCYPRVATPAYQAGVFTGYAQGGPAWINCSSPAVEHYSWKAFISEFPCSAGTGMAANPACPISILEIQPKYFISLKQTR